MTLQGDMVIVAVALAFAAASVLKAWVAAWQRARELQARLELSRMETERLSILRGVQRATSPSERATRV